MEKRTALIGWVLLLSAPLWAEPPQELFKAGNTFYAAGKFSEAAQQYQAAADAGLKNWILEYNLGNAYWRAGQIGKGILHYERAFRLNSGQADVLYNLNLATNRAGDAELPAGALPALAWRFFYIFSVNGLTVLTSVVFILICVCCGLVLVSSPRVVSGDPSFMDSRLRGNDKEIMTALLTLFVIAGSWLVMRIYLLEHPKGVVVTSVAEIRSGPSVTYPANFTIPEGHRVIILEEQEPVQGWIEVGVPQEGLKGWVPESSVEVI